MKRAIIALSSSLVIVGYFTACSSSSSSSGSANGGSTTTSSTSGTTQTTPAASCAQPGDKGNDKGVGEYCTPGGGECANFPDANVCLADLFQDQWFCTHLSCTTDAECGTAAHCDMESGGSACVPDKCGGAPDAGTTDAGDGG